MAAEAASASVDLARYPIRSALAKLYGRVPPVHLERAGLRADALID